MIRKATLFSFVLLCFGCSAQFPSVSFAQQQPGLSREVVVFKGTVEGSRGVYLQAKSEDGKSYTIKAPEDVEAVKYEGKGVPGMLQPGMFLRLEGVFDPAKGRTTVPISQLEIFNPMKPKHAQQKDIAEITPGIYPTGGGGAGGGAGLFVDPNDKPSRTKPQVQASSFKVIGQLVGISKKGININAGRVLAVELSPTTQISVSDYGWRFAQPGDQVQVEGFYFPPNETQVLAQRIRITGVNPLGVPVEKPKPVKKKEE